ncbi:MAG: hypothetical protein P0Y62_06950 [Candidatus Chryseobacterium colombiense]|nr:hypothetical protein [Chryseobacterium sp.]WEK71290.1 MAG: hypothetical protein P0Y62_06950 [Chryseobacterium sp.]
MKSIVLFSCALGGVLLSCKKQAEYRNSSLQDTIIASDTLNDKIPVQDALTNIQPDRV